MLKVEMNGKEGDVSLDVCGNTIEITADVSLLIKMIYDRMEKETKDYFADAITRLMNDGVYKMNSDEIAKKTKKEEKDTEKKKNAAKEELLKCLGELLEEAKKLVEEK